MLLCNTYALLFHNYSQFLLQPIWGKTIIIPAQYQCLHLAQETKVVSIFEIRLVFLEIKLPNVKTWLVFQNQVTYVHNTHHFNRSCS